MGSEILIDAFFSDAGRQIQTNNCLLNPKELRPFFG
jgi:hypothetical protein